VDLVLSAPLQIPALAKRLTDDDYAKLSQIRIPLKSSKSQYPIAKSATRCNGRFLPEEPEKWKETVTDVPRLPGRRMPLWFALKDDEFVSGKRFETLINLFAKNFGPQTPVEPRVSTLGRSRALLIRTGTCPPLLLKGGSAKFVGMNFLLPQRFDAQ